MSSDCTWEPSVASATEYVLTGDDTELNALNQATLTELGTALEPAFSLRTPRLPRKARMSKMNLFVPTLIIITFPMALGLGMNAAAGETTRAYIANFVDDTVSVIDVDTQAVVATIPVAEEPRGVAALRDGTKVFVSAQKGFVSVIDTTTNTVAETISVGSTPYGIAASPDGQRVYVTDRDDNTISIIDAQNDVVLDSVPGGRVGALVLPDGTSLYAANGTFMVDPIEPVSVISTATNLLITEVDVGTSPYGLAALEDSSLLFVSNENSANVSVVDTSDNMVLATVPVGSFPHGIAATSDGSRVYVANLGDDSVSVIDVSSFSVTKTIPTGSGPYAVSATPAGDQVYVSNSGDGSISVIDTSTDTVIATIGVGTSPAFTGQFITSVPICGDGELDSGEQCDDGNQLDGDCCSSSCQRPSGCLSAFAKSLLLLKESFSGREKLIVKMIRGSGFGQTELGNPLEAGGTAYSLCIWDDDAQNLVGQYNIDQAGETCGLSARDCWRPIGGVPPAGKGYQYRDPDGVSNGLRKIAFQSNGSGYSKLVAKGKGPNLPSIASQLTSASSVTVQFHATDGVACLESTLSDIKKQSGDFFQATN